MYFWILSLLFLRTEKSHNINRQSTTFVMTQGGCTLPRVLEALWPYFCTGTDPNPLKICKVTDYEILPLNNQTFNNFLQLSINAWQ
ncbi:hypothetical protein HPG69_005320 [Diceros bicornis minor]|uniref:Secreted protein n=1 Tax=Diceros bicornis minor TaxID=77932 RepID=A0A7J7EL59_DICBM|nr:hypothetical protein HPG69_005320 [Diceros bicornis minor]